MLIGDCKACKLAKARKPHLEGASADEDREMYGDDGNDTEEEDEERPIDCCMRRLLSLQPDFAGQKSQLELVPFILLLTDNLLIQIVAYRSRTRDGVPFPAQVPPRDESY